jgi:hypothetical protein
VTRAEGRVAANTKRRAGIVPSNNIVRWALILWSRESSAEIGRQTSEKLEELREREIKQSAKLIQNENKLVFIEVSWLGD